MGSLPNPAAAWSETWTRASPATAWTRRSRTAVEGSPGNASASRHSMIPVLVTQRPRQISEPSSYRPPQTFLGSLGVTA